ncbi:MAG: PulJ/GspJ family protein [Chthoniobacteraceae bacterium]
MRRTTREQGFTLAELLIGMSITVMAGGALFTLVHAVAILAAKNAAINVTHQQARQSIHAAVREIHGAVSIPQLLDENLQPMTGASKNGPAAGVSYQVVHAGPFLIWNNTNANSSNVRLDTRHEILKYEDPAKTEGYRLIIPAFQVEAEILDIPAANGAGIPQTTNVRLKNKLGVNIDCSNAEPAYVAYVTRRAALVVVDGQLHRYSPLEVNAPSKVIARNVTSATPFSIPADNRFVQMQMIARDERAMSRGFKAVDLQMNLTIPYRYRLTSRQ